MFRLKISWGLAVCLTLFLTDTGNAAPRMGGFPAPRGEASWLDLETLLARAWSWFARATIDSNGHPKHGLIIDPNGDPSATPGDGSENGAATGPNGSP
jgi:hypothetical protein